jgi:DNA repair protein RecO (recombination protein O)
MASMEKRTFNAQAIVLHHLDYGETDRILTLFTLEYGKIQAIVKGVKKITSRKAGHLEPFTQVHLFLARGKDLAIITQAETMNAFPKIKENLELMGIASYMVELIQRFTYEEGENRALYKLLLDSLDRLAQENHPRTILHYFEVRLMDLLGFRPNLQTCCLCKKDIQPEKQFFSSKDGGVLCPSCGYHEKSASPVSVGALKYFRHFQRSRYALIKHLVIPTHIEQEFSQLLEGYFTYLLERNLKSPQFMRDITDQNSA